MIKIHLNRGCASPQIWQFSNCDHSCEVCIQFKFLTWTSLEDIYNFGPLYWSNQNKVTSSSILFSSSSFLLIMTDFFSTFRNHERIAAINKKISVLDEEFAATPKHKKNYFTEKNFFTPNINFEHLLNSFSVASIYPRFCCMTIFIFHGKHLGYWDHVLPRATIEGWTKSYIEPMGIWLGVWIVTFSLGLQILCQ